MKRSWTRGVVSAAMCIAVWPAPGQECIEAVVRDPAGLPVAGAKVSAAGQEAETDSSGAARLCGLPESGSLLVRSAQFESARADYSPATRRLEIDLKLRPRVETPVVVTGVTEPRELADVDRSLDVLPVAEPKAPAWSLAAVLDQDSSVHVRDRGPDGAQADLSIRGSTFDQVLVLVNGFRMSDAQTGHHAMDLPLPLEAVEQAEVLHGSGATLYGSDAIGGAVNFVTRKPAARELRLMSGAGQHGWNRLSTFGGFQLGRWTQSAAVARDFSTGFLPGRDFRNLAASAETFFDSDAGTTALLFGWNERPFGANGFYGPWNSWERTGTTFASASQTLGRSADRPQHRFRFAFRRHRDRFILCREGCVFDGQQYAPGDFGNLHRLDTYQSDYSLGGDLTDRVRLSGGLQFLSEGIDSTVAGQRRRERAAAFVLLQARPTDRLSLSAGLREEIWRKWRAQASPTFAAGYWLGGGVKLRAQAGGAFRVPTYTDLYHRDPGNVGNPTLRPERAWNYEAGVDWYLPAGWRLSAAWFRRLEDDTIDWVQDAGSTIFEARNFQELDFQGGEIELRIPLRGAAELWAEYTALRASRKLPVNAVSRYVFNFPLNKGVGGFRSSLPGGFLVQTQLGVYERAWQDPKALWDLLIGWERGRWQPFVQATNLLDVEHEAFQGLAQPGRWVRGGLRLRVF